MPALLHNYDFNHLIEITVLNWFFIKSSINLQGSAQKVLAMFEVAMNNAFLIKKCC